MYPTQLACDDVWRTIYSLLPSRDLLSLWKSHPYFTRSLMEILRQKRKHEYGIDLVSLAELIRRSLSAQCNSLLTTYSIIRQHENILTDGIYHLRSDIVCDVPTDFFILHGNITFHQHAKIVILRGNFFRLDDCQFNSGNYTVYFPHGGHLMKFQNCNVEVNDMTIDVRNTLFSASHQGKSNCNFITATSGYSTLRNINMTLIECQSVP